MIAPSPFAECIKTGAYFSLVNDDRVFTGDLFYDFAKREFQMRGVPSWEGRMTHCLPKKEAGPIKLMMLVDVPLEIAARPDGRFTDFRFKKAKCTSELATFIEEWYGDKGVMGAITEMWEVVPNLTWFK